MRASIAILGIVYGGLQLAYAAIPLPVWVGDPQTTSCRYLFETDDETPGASVEVNPYGSSQGFVEVAPDATGTGWQDPENIFHVTLTPDSGAWDLGISGTVEIDLEVGPALAPGQTYEVDFQVRAICYTVPGLIPLPSLSAAGLTPDSEVSMTEEFAEDPSFPGASWQEEVWEGVFKDVTDETLTFVVSAPDDGTSVVEALEVYTRYRLISPPPVLTDAMFLPNGDFQVTLTGIPGLTYEVEYSEDLISWDFKEEVTLVSNSVLITDADAQNFSSRYYRVAEKAP